MGADQLSGVLDSVMRSGAARAGVAVDEDMAAARLAMMKAQVEQQSDSYYVSSRCLDDGIIDPRDTRDIVGLCLAICHNKPVEGTMEWGVHRL